MDKTIPTTDNVNTPDTDKVVYNYFVAIKLNESAKAYYFSTNFDDLKVGDKVVIETVRGLELGKVDSSSQPMSKYKLNL